MKNYFNPYDLTDAFAKLAHATQPMTNQEAVRMHGELANKLQGFFYSIQWEFDTMQAKIDKLEAEVEELKKAKEPNPHLDLDLSN